MADQPARAQGAPPPGAQEHNPRPDLSGRWTEIEQDKHDDRMTEEILKRAGERIYLASKPDIATEILDAVEAVDPTGIVGVLNAFNQPICGDVAMPR